MSSHPYSVSLAVPAAAQDDANALAVALGWDVWPGRTFSVPLSADGAAPASHYGCHTWATQGFLDTLSAAQGGALPPVDWSEYELTEVRVGEVVAALLDHVQTGDVGFDTFLADSGLQRVVVEE
ncbi:hypothetical protein [Minwuia thermotolerans]|uniref:Uncharacterized protein n=1 Tax=Minwuia thermotolerans TaxID=2056226 RepID=A0A2M9G2N3_9PROT|nr:hypothetical protein [Minwuia thermotolerans]PJK29973.1 hypothetical protein CVT23_09405 [Minwuia thermotolerans]